MPLLGVWIGSSLASFLGGPLWLPLAVGALCFPVLPLGWDAWARSRAKKRAPQRTAILTVVDRMVLRTLAINIVFVGGLLATFPATVFSALSERGDWMLDGRNEPWAAQTRDTLHSAADGMQWLHELTHPNAYEEFIDEGSTGENVVINRGDWKRTVGPKARKVGDRVDPTSVYSSEAWPFAPQLHPLVTSIPADQQATPEAIGRYFAAHESDPTQRLKAVHDYVADRVAYDVVSFKTRSFAPQDPLTVLRTGKGVCAGYSKLMLAIGEAAGLEIVVVRGKTRAWGDLGHAWNAAKVDGKWVLLDATWDAGSVGDDGFTKRYKTTYLMAPPEAFLTTHFPTDEKWQLREEPLSLGDFLRAPDLTPKFYAWGFEDLSPSRSQVANPGDSLTVTLSNPHDFELSAVVYQGDTWDGPPVRCVVEPNKTTMRCPMTGPGQHLVTLFGPDNQSIGKIHIAGR